MNSYSHEQMNECLSFIASCTFHCLALLLLYAALFIVLSSVLFIVYVCCLVEWKTPLSDGISARRVLVITARDRFGRPARAGVPFQVAKKESTNTSTESKEIKELVPVDMKVQDDMLFHVTVESLGSYACFFFLPLEFYLLLKKTKLMHCRFYLCTLHLPLYVCTCTFLCRFFPTKVFQATVRPYALKRRKRPLPWKI